MVSHRMLFGDAEAVLRTLPCESDADLGFEFIHSEKGDHVDAPGHSAV